MENKRIPILYKNNFYFSPNVRQSANTIRKLEYMISVLSTHRQDAQQTNFKNIFYLYVFCVCVFGMTFWTFVCVRTSSDIRRAGNYLYRLSVYIFIIYLRNLLDLGISFLSVPFIQISSEILWKVFVTLQKKRISTLLVF